MSDDTDLSRREPSALKRRGFLRHLGLAATGAGAMAAAAEAASAQVSSEGSGRPPGGVPSGINNTRIAQAYDLRLSMARQDALAGAAVNVDNGDLALYADKGGSYTKGLPHDAYGRVDLNAFAALQTALNSGKFSDFEKIPLGGTRTLTGPQSGMAKDLEVMNCAQFGQPQVLPAPAAASDQTATELVEHYWAALLRDVPYTQFATNSLAAQAAAELSAQPSYQGPRDGAGKVTPNLLFRGGLPGETIGPYISQFFHLPAIFGSQPVSQQQYTYLPNIDYATDFLSWLAIQNGVDTGLRNQVDSQLRYRRNGRDLTAVTHMDVLFQEYFIAFLALMTINAVQSRKPVPPVENTKRLRHLRWARYGRNDRRSRLQSPQYSVVPKVVDSSARQAGGARRHPSLTENRRPGQNCCPP